MTLAEASVAVPFVGAVIGAIAVAQIIQLGSMLETVNLLQTQLGSPHMAIPGRMNPTPVAGAGSIKLTLR